MKHGKSAGFTLIEIMLAVALTGIIAAAALAPLLFTVKSLNEGLTIENIEQVITTGGSCNTQTHENRIARGKTFDYANPNKVCVIINLYIDDFTIKIDVNQEDNTDILKDVKSRDKQKLIERQSTTVQTPIWVSSISEIFY